MPPFSGRQPRGASGRVLAPYNSHMNVELTPDQRAFVQRAIESGRLDCEEDAVQEALALWEERERTRSPSFGR